MKSKRYVANPVEIEAIQYIIGDNISKITNFTKGDARRINNKLSDNLNIHIPTVSGEVRIEDGDYIIKNKWGITVERRTAFNKNYGAKRNCLFCKVDISNSHFNKKFCSSSCAGKKEYRDLTPEQKQKQRIQENKSRKERCKSPFYVLQVNRKARERDRKVRAFLAAYKLKRGCADCGYKKHQSALDFDHIKGKKEINVSFSKSITRAKQEILKCEVVCSNCHRIRTYKRYHNFI